MGNTKSVTLQELQESLYNWQRYGGHAIPYSNRATSTTTPQSTGTESMSNIESVTLQELQESLYNWQRYNFGDQDNELVLLGMYEEAGELCHAQLKLEQGIRGTPEELEFEMRDAIGDICIYMLNYLSGVKWSITDLGAAYGVKRSVDPAEARGSVISVYRLIGEIDDRHSRDTKIFCIGQLINELLYLCALKGWNLEGIVRETWSRISKRNWKEFPETGLPPEEN